MNTIHPKSIFAKCTRLVCLLSFASLFIYFFKGGKPDTGGGAAYSGGAGEAAYGGGAYGGEASFAGGADYELT